MAARSLNVAVTGNSESPSKIMMSVRGFSFVIDQPQSHGGTDAGPCPVELVLPGLAGWMNVA